MDVLLRPEGGEEPSPRLKMECVASWRLFGWVQVGKTRRERG